MTDAEPLVRVAGRRFEFDPHTLDVESETCGRESGYPEGLVILRLETRDGVGWGEIRLPLEVVSRLSAECRAKVDT